MSWRPIALAMCVALGWPLTGAAASEGAVLAYVDPGAGSFVLQALLAALAGIIVTANVYWTKIKSFFGVRTGSDDPEDSEPTSADRPDE